MTWTLAPALTQLRAQINALWPERNRDVDGSIGDEAHQTRKSDHNPDADDVVTAIDVTDDDSVGADMRQVAEVLRLGRDPRIKYVIHEGKLFSSYATSSYPAWTWRPYSGTNGHFSHLHISVTQAGKYNDSEWNLLAFQPREPRVPRRFARVFEFDRNGPPAEGTPEQQAAVRSVFEKYLEPGNRLDKILYAVDVARNKKGWKFLPVSFVPLEGLNGFAYPSRILLDEDLTVDFMIQRIFLHELGHIVGWNVLYPKDSSEAWAEEFRYWVQGGDNGNMLDGPTWDRLKDLV